MILKTRLTTGGRDGRPFKILTIDARRTRVPSTISHSRDARRRKNDSKDDLGIRDDIVNAKRKVF